LSGRRGGGYGCKPGEYGFSLMFVIRGLCRLASMSARADTTPLNWSDLGVNEFPTGTVTSLLAGVEDRRGYGKRTQTRRPPRSHA
jgi:hypothetical protein